MTAQEYARLVVAGDAVIAQGQAVALATAEGYRVRTVRSVRLQTVGDLHGRRPEYMVRLGVEPKQTKGCDCE